MTNSPDRDEFVSDAATQQGPTVLVRDLDTAIYLYMRGIEDPSLKITPLEAFKLGPGRHEVVFSDPRGISRQLEREFLQDRAVLFAAAQRNLKRFMRRRAKVHERSRPSDERSRTRRAEHRRDPSPAAPGQKR